LLTNPKRYAILKEVGRQNLKRLKILLLLSLILLLISGCSKKVRQEEKGAEALPPEKTEGKAVERGEPSRNKGKVLHMYTALDTNESIIYIPAFEKETGIDVKWVRLSGGEVLARVRNEKNNPQVGMWFGGSSPDFIAAKEEGLLAPYKPKVNFPFPKGTIDPENYWTGFYFGGIGFASNTEILKRRNLSPPTSWSDLIKPEFKGEIGISYAYTSGTAFTILATLVQLMGEEAAFKYIKKLDRNIHHYNKSGSACVTQVGLGEIGVGIAFSHDILKKGPSKGYPVVLTFPQEGTGYEIGAMALVQGGPDHEQAKKFIDWALSVKAQNLMKEWFRIPLNPRAEVVKGAVTAKEMNLIDFDAVKAGREKRGLIERWREITRQ